MYLDCSDADDAARLATPLLELLAGPVVDDYDTLYSDFLLVTAALARANVIELDVSGVDDGDGDDDHAEEIKLPPVCVHFDGVSSGKQPSRKTATSVLASDDDELLSIAQLSVMLYDSWNDSDSRWLDLAERLGAASEAAECVGGRSLTEVLRGSVLRDVAASFLVLASSHSHMRRVLVETLTLQAVRLSRYSRSDVAGSRSAFGMPQMWQMLKYAFLGSDEHFNSIVWYLGQIERETKGRLWVDADGHAPVAPVALVGMCALARGNKKRTRKLITKVLQHSVVLREPVRLFLDAHWKDYYQRVWGRTTDERGHELEGLGNHGYDAPGRVHIFLDAHLRSICNVLCSAAISYRTSQPPHVFLLHALQVAAVNDPGGVREELASACKVRYGAAGPVERMWGPAPLMPPTEAMTYLCDAVGPYLGRLSAEPPTVPPPTWPPSHEALDTMYWGYMEEPGDWPMLETVDRSGRVGKPINPLGYREHHYLVDGNVSDVYSFGMFRRDFFEQRKRDKKWLPYGNFAIVKRDADGRWPSHTEVRDEPGGQRWARVTAPSPVHGYLKPAMIIKDWHRVES